MCVYIFPKPKALVLMSNQSAICITAGVYLSLSEFRGWVWGASVSWHWPTEKPRHIHGVFEHFPGYSVPKLYNPFMKISPGIQSKPLWCKFRPFPAILSPLCEETPSPLSTTSFQEAAKRSKDLLKAPFVQAGQPQLLLVLLHPQPGAASSLLKAHEACASSEHLTNTFN